jgi:hypothetical protein
MNSTKVSRIVLRFHGSFLILLTSLLIVLSSLGTFRGLGVFQWLHANPMADVGLFQAYSLMMVVGIVLWLGSFQDNLWIWDMVGLLAHISPLLANFMFADVLTTIGLPSTIPLHGFFILLELSTLLYYRFPKTETSHKPVI